MRPKFTHLAVQEQARTLTSMYCLLRLKDGMKGGKAKNSLLEDWHCSNSSAHYSFSGVKCDNNCRVTQFLPCSAFFLQKLDSWTSWLASPSLSLNNVTGHFPNQLANLTRLTYFNISHNQFTGHFPALPLHQLEVLDAYDNNFTGPLPLEIANLKYLSFAGNYFYGEIPHAYSQLQSFEYLRLNENELTGRIPPILGSLKNLKELYVGYNNYTRGIPPEFGSLHSLQILDMAKCNLSGEIPEARLFEQPPYLASTFQPSYCHHSS
ncbi:hypothetical protein L6164_035317 [Bauhinia variegata]|uniref:Uncharacterized protein n=1 Tax=Bauhinia variegata TaxID=167791 RepID=A0ACB9KDJ2_BAUVA|nr:hypothetical protein L6164_035317 [Bauhinia variegata]